MWATLFAVSVAAALALTLIAVMIDSYGDERSSWR